MNMPTDELASLVRAMEPALNPGCYAFATLVDDRPIELTSVIAFIREPEGTSIVISEDLALKQELQIHFRAAWITLTVYSDIKANYSFKGNADVSGLVTYIRRRVPLTQALDP